MIFVFIRIRFDRLGAILGYQEWLLQLHAFKPTFRADIAFDADDHIFLKMAVILPLVGILRVIDQRVFTG